MEITKKVSPEIWRIMQAAEEVRSMGVSVMSIANAAEVNYQALLRMTEGRNSKKVNKTILRKALDVSPEFRAAYQKRSVAV